jgi:hypothetical protein
MDRLDTFIIEIDKKRDSTELAQYFAYMGAHIGGM